MANVLKIHKHYWIITAIYFIAWLPLLINYDGVYWDGWVLTNQENGVLIDLYDRLGRLFAIYIHTFLQSIGNGIFPYRLLTFFSYLSISLSVYYLARPKYICGKSIAVYLAVLVAIFPLNTARITMMCVEYGLCVALFFLAFILMINKKSNIQYRVLALLLFFISFDMQSLLVFYILPISYLFFISASKYKKNEKKLILNLKQIKIFILKNIDFLLLPFLFFLIKKLFFNPYGSYDNYNNINISWQAITFVISILGIIFLILFLFLFLIKNKESDLKNNFIFLVIGFILFISAIFPYYAVGQFPWINNKYNGWPIILFPITAFIVLLNAVIYSFIFQIKENHHILKTMFVYLGAISILLIAAILPYYVVDKFEWADRHFILMPLGVSIMFIYSINNFFKKNVVHFVFSSCIVLFVFFHLNSLKDFQIDSFKQDAIMMQVKEIKEIRNSKNEIILFNDETLDYNAINRSYRFYEWNGMLKKVFDEQTRYGISKNEYRGEESVLLNLSKYKEYNFYDYKGDGKKIAGTINIKRGNNLFTFSSLIELLYLKIFFHKKYKMQVINYINVSYDTSN